MTDRFALADHPLMAFVAVSDPDAAKRFYRDTLGLRLVSEEPPFALVFDAHGIMLRVTLVKQVSPAAYTVLGWQVPDIATATHALAAAGVRFERYPGMPQDEAGIWRSPSGARVAWFRDPDGNTLSLTQF